MALAFAAVFTHSAGAVTDTYSYTGAVQTFVVPAGVTTLTIEVWGAQGGYTNRVATENTGGYATGDLAVSPGDTVDIYVGGQPSPVDGLTGGYNGGGTGDAGGAGGGGASDIRTSGGALSDRFMVAAGGGGAGFWSGQDVIGGAGGGLTGGDGYRLNISTAGGGGGTQSASANGTCSSFNNPAVAGGFGFGGSTNTASCGCEGYGGGGGWYGGGGSGNCRGGGGGSSYIAGTGLTSGSTSSGVRLGNGEVQITYGAATTFSVGGVVSGLTGSGLELHNNGTDTLAVAADGSFTFGTAVADGATYLVTVLTDPAGQTCSVTNGSGTITTAVVLDIDVVCTDDVVPAPQPPTPPEAVPSVSAYGLAVMMFGLLLVASRRLRMRS